MAEKKATRDAYGETILALGKENENIVVFDADLSSATRTGKFAAEFPERHFNAGIAEMNMAGMAAGMATCGKIPFVSTFAVFGTGRIYDMVRDSICYANLNVKLALTHAGLTVGEDGATHQSIEDIALMNVLPNMTVFVPADAAEAAQAIRAAAEIKGPVYIRLGRSKIDVIHDEKYQFKPGKIEVAANGTDVAIAACGLMVAKALEAKERLRDYDIDAAVLNVSTIKPLDAETIIEYAKKTGAFVTCEEHSVYGGLGSVIAKAVTEEYPVPMAQVAVMDTFGESGDAELLLAKYGLTAEEIVKKTLAVVKQKQLYR